MFRMKVTTNYKFRVFEKGKDYEDKLIPVDVFERWLERKLAKNIEKEISQEENLIEDFRWDEFRKLLAESA